MTSLSALPLILVIGGIIGLIIYITNKIDEKNKRGSEEK